MRVQKTIMLLAVLATLTVAHAEEKKILVKDMAQIKKGTEQPIKVTPLVGIKNQKNDLCRIVLLSLNVSALENKVKSASFSFVIKRVPENDYKVYVYGVKDSAPFQDWKGGKEGNVTWNSVKEKGLFTPKQDLYSSGDPNLVLLGAEEVEKEGDINKKVVISGEKLKNLINKDSDGVLTLVIAVNVDVNAGMRTHKDKEKQPVLTVTTE